MLSDFLNSFADRLSGKFATKSYLNIPSHLQYVATRVLHKMNLSVFLMHGPSFQRTWAKFAMWLVYAVRVVMAGLLQRDGATPPSDSQYEITRLVRNC